MIESMQSAMLYAWINIICLILLGIIFFGTIRYGGRNKRTTLFLFMIVLVAVHSVFDTLWAFMAGGVFAKNIDVAYLFNDICFLSLIGAIAVWGMYSETFIRRKKELKPVFWVLLFIPLAVAAIYICTSFWHHGAYYISDEINYVRGKYYFYALGIPYAYFVYCSVRSFVLSRFKEYYQYRRILVMISLYSVIVCAFFAAQVLMNSIMPVMCVGATIALLLVYFETLNSKITIDPLTQLTNRGYLERILNYRIKDDNDGKKLYFMMMDIDNFKIINDVHGHVEGDNALKTVAEILKKYTPSGFVAARYGGDEFAVFGVTDDENDVIAFTHRLCEKFEELAADSERKYPLNISIGYACKEDGYYSVPDLINAADEELYKAKIKKRSQNGGGG